MLKRRDFIALLSGATATPLLRPFVAHAQGLPVIGVLGSTSAAASLFGAKAFEQGLAEQGFAVGRNVAVEYRWADGHYERLPGLAAELVRMRVALIATFAGTPTAHAAKAATATVPIVFTLGSDPVAEGLVASMNRPGGNITGSTNLTITLAQKRLEVMHELVPRVRRIAFLANPANSTNASVVREMENAAKVLGLEVHAVHAQSESDLDPAFATIAQIKAGGLVVGGDPFHLSQHRRIVALAARHKVPATYYLRNYVTAGGLMSYGNVVADSYRQIGIYAGRILKGEKPADLPVLQPTRFQLVINMKAARALSIDVPTSILLRADEVIE